MLQLSLFHGLLIANLEIDIICIRRIIDRSNIIIMTMHKDVEANCVTTIYINCNRYANYFSN